MTIAPFGATETLLGESRSACLAEIPSPKLPALPVPATVVIVPPETILTRLSPESVITKAPFASGATPFGAFNRAEVAAPPSPHAAVGVAHATPVPATVEITPALETFRTF